MPGENYETIAEDVLRDNVAQLREFKRLGRQRLNAELKHRRDQYGEVVQIPEDAVLFDYKRRFVAYKRPWMPFENIDELKDILLTYNAHYIMAGMMAVSYTHLTLPTTERV